MLLVGADVSSLSNQAQLNAHSQKEEAKSRLPPSYQEEHSLTEESGGYEAFWKQNSASRSVHTGKKHFSTAGGKPRAPTLDGLDMTYTSPKAGLSYNFKQAAAQEREEEDRGKEVLLVKDQLSTSDQATLWRILQVLLLTR